MLARVKQIYLKSHTSVNSSAVLDGLLAIFSTFQLPIKQEILSFSYPVKLTDASATSQKLLHGGFVFPLRGQGIYCFRYYILRYDICIIAPYKNFKAVNNLLQAHGDCMGFF